MGAFENFATAIGNKIKTVKTAADSKVSSVTISEDKLIVTKGEGNSATSDSYDLPKGGSGSVVTTPVVTGDSSIIRGIATSLVFTSSSRIVNGSIASFEYTVDNGTPQTVNAVNNEATASITISGNYNDGDIIDIVVTAIDDSDNISQPSTYSMTVVIASVNTPTCTPGEVTLYPNAALTLTGSSFGSTGYSDTQDNAEFVVLNSNDTSSTPVWQSIGNITTSATVPANTLSAGNYYVACRYKGATLGWSDWSTPVSVTVNAAFVNQATLTAPTANAEIVFNDTGVVVTTSEFSVTGGSDTHVRTNYKICTDSNGSNVVAEASGSTSAEKLSYTLTGLNLSPNITHYAFAQHIGSTLGAGEWSNGVAFVTKKASVNTPSITSPTENATVIFVNGVTVTTNAFSVNLATDTHIFTSWKICTNNDGTGIVVEANNSSDLVNHTFTNLNLTDGQTYYVFAKHTGTRFGDSEWSAGVGFVAQATYVEAPVVNALPAKNFLKTKGITISTNSEFVTNPVNQDSYEATRFSISTDAIGSNVIASYVTPSGTSQYATNWISTSSDRRICRHPSNKGSVIEFDHFGTTLKVFVADAAYRGKAKFGTYNKDSANPNISTTGYVSNSDSSITAKAAIGTVTDATLQSRFPEWNSDLSMKSLCDTWMTYKNTTDSYPTPIAGVPAVKMCRDTLTDVFSGGCDLPDIYSLVVLFIEGETIDSLDPTATANPTKALGATINTSGHGYMNGASSLWSSSEYSSNHCMVVYYNGNADGNGKSGELGVVPCYLLSSDWQPEGTKVHHFVPADITNVSNIADNTQLYAGIEFKGSTLGFGVKGILGFRSTDPYIQAPVIVSPSTDSTLSKPLGITVSLDDITVIGSDSSDTQSSATVIICSSNDTSTAVATKTVSDTSTTIEFTNSDLSLINTNTDYYIFAKRIGTTYGESQYSEPVKVQFEASITTDSGRKVYRHESDEGSVVEFDHFGDTLKVFVADAAYRGKAKFGTYGKDSSNPNITKTGYVANSNSAINEKAAIGTVTDATLQSRFPEWNSDLSMKSLCDTWMTYEGTTDSTSSSTGGPITGVPAVRMCRNTLTDVFSDGCDLPDIYSTAVLFIEGETIDSLDPTAATNPTKALGATMNTNGHGYMDGASVLWSSSEYNSNRCLYIHYNSNAYYNNKSNEYGVVPCKQLSITTRGCTLYRSANGIATTIEFKDWTGNPRKMEVIDAAYRPNNKKQFGTYNVDSSLANFASTNKNGTFYIGGESSDYTNNVDLPATLTNDLIYTQWSPSLATDLTAKENCDVWMTYEGTKDTYSTPTIGVPAIEACRVITTDSSNGSWDLPNVYELMILFMLSDIIDSLDPTASSYATMKIGKTHSSGRFRGTYFWSSTEDSATNVRRVNYGGYCNNGTKATACAVLPVRELSA